MSEALQQTCATGVVKVETLAELDGIYAPLCSSAKLHWNNFHLERYFVNCISTTNNYFERHLICIPLVVFHRPTETTPRDYREANK